MDRRRRLFLAAILLCMFMLPACDQAGEGSFSWRLYGFETHRFTLGGEEISMRLDTSGSGRYEVDLREDAICIMKDDRTVWEGGFLPAEEYAVLAEEILASEDFRVIERTGEDTPVFLLYCGNTDEDPTYAFLSGIEDSGFGAIFSAPPGSIATEEEARDYARRLKFVRSD